MWLEGKTIRRDRLRFLSETVNETARMARVNVSLVLIAALYLALTLLSATDENLLRNSIVTLPQLQTGISLKLSYIFAPIVFLYLHVQTLFLLIVLAKKVKRFQTALDDEITDATEKAECWDWLSAFSFVQVHGGTGTFARFTRILVWLGISAIPLTLFFLIDLSFMRFQSLGISVIHHVCFLADLVAVYLFNRQAVPDRLQFHWCYLRELFRPNGGSWVSGERMRKLGIISWFTLKTVMVALLLIYAWPPEYKSIPSDAPKNWYDEEIIGFNIFDDVLCPESPWRGVCRKLDVSGNTLTRFGSDWDAAVAPKKFEGDEAEQYRRRFGLDLEKRSLRFADFRKAWIPAIRLTWADLRGAHFTSVRANGASLAEALMDGADLIDAEMNGANLSGAEMNGANLSDAEMNNANLFDAEMNGANLSYAEMNDTILDFAEMNGANLSYAEMNDTILDFAEMNDADLLYTKMNDADLLYTKMNGANLSDAKMNNANLFDAEMNGANLSGAEMYGANLIGAEMNGANLFDAKMNGANLIRAEMNDANLFDAEMNGADLFDAKMNNANLFDAEMNGANLSGAEMYGANLIGAEMYGANLFDAKMNGANLIGAEMNDANLSDAEMNGADLFDAKMNGANLSDAEMNDADLSGAEMNGANLSDAEMNDADLSGAEMNGANLSDAEMNDADLSGAEMNGANLSDAEMNGTNLDFTYVAGAHGLPRIDDETSLNFTYWKLPNLRDGTGSYQERVEEYLEHLPTGLRLRWKPEISLKDHLLHYMNLGQPKPDWLP